jgi:hypothetical protein
MQSVKHHQALSVLAKALLVALLATPAIATLSTKQREGENRRMAEPPQRPTSVEEALKYSASFDAWANDNFSLRAALVRLNTKVRYKLFGQYPTSQVVQGREGRTFLTTSHPAAPAYAMVFSACGYHTDGVTEVVDAHIRRLLSLSRERGIAANLLVVPSAPAVHVDQLPRWASTLCHTATPPMQRWLAQPGVAAAMQQHVAYPLEQMRAASRDTDLFPRTFFHWGGAGPRLTAEWTLRQFYGVEPSAATPYISHKEWLPSDIGHLFPGIKRPSEVDVMDMAASHIDFCYGARCFDHAPPILKDFEVIRLRNHYAPRKRLVLITDSFGPPAAPWFARYYKEVLLFNANTLYLVKQDTDMEPVRQFVFADAAGTDFIVLYHDATVHAARIKQDFSQLLPGF